MTTKEIVTIGCTNSWYRLYYYKDRYINSIKFYRNSKVLADIRFGWLEENNLGDIKEIRIVKPKKANKIDLTRKDNFVVTTKKDYESCLHYDLYIYVDGVDVNLDIVSTSSRTTEEYTYSYTYNYALMNVKIDTLKFQMSVLTSTKKVDKPEEKHQVNIVKDLLGKININMCEYDISKMLGAGLINPLKLKTSNTTDYSKDDNCEKE